MSSYNKQQNQTDKNQFQQSAIPWENIANLGFLKAFIFTLQQCLLQPNTFFINLKTPFSCTNAWLFGLVIGSLSTTLNIITKLVTKTYFHDNVFFSSSAFLTPEFIIISPIISTIELSLIAFYLYLVFYIWQKKNSFKTVFALVCYCNCASIFTIVPVAGNLISSLWMIYLVASGMSSINGISKKKAAIVIFFPLLIFIGLVTLLGFTFLLIGWISIIDLLQDILMSYR